MRSTIHDNGGRILSWKANIKIKDRIELRKNFSSQPHYADVLIVVNRDDIVMSMNGKAVMTLPDIIEMTAAIGKAKIALGDE